MTEQPCQHTLIKHEPHGVVAGFFTCSDCGAKLVLRTKSGHIITTAEMDRWIDEAEAGYDIER